MLAPKLKSLKDKLHSDHTNFGFLSNEDHELLYELSALETHLISTESIYSFGKKGGMYSIAPSGKICGCCGRPF